MCRSRTSSGFFTDRLAPREDVEHYYVNSRARSGASVSRGSDSKPMNRRKFICSTALTAWPLLRIAHASDADPWERAAGIARDVSVPRFAERVFDITRFGARGDGSTLNTAAIAAAIAECTQQGGGRVLVPAGRFLTGAIHLKSNVELYLADGATLLFDTHPESYPLVFTRWEGMELMNYSPLIYAYGEKNIAIRGRGTLDGQASAELWWAWKGPWGGGVEYGWKEGMPDQRPARKK